MMDRRVPVLTADRRHEIAARLSGADGLLVGLDFDGTLAPIADDPDEPTITPSCKRAVAKILRSPDATVAVVSGRELSDLRPRVGLDGIVYAGNHGMELYRAGKYTAHPEAQRHRSALHRSLERLSNRLADVPGWEIEDKGLTATVHVRHTPPEWTDTVRSEVAETVGSVGDGLHVSAGKGVFELRPAIEWDKGAAIAYLSEQVPDGWSAMYLGDDTTDEDAFRAVRPDGVGILVGERDGTHATYRLPSQEAVASFLDWVADGLLSGDRARSR